MFGSDPSDVIVPVVMFLLIFSVPLAKILTDHQRKMAELLAQNQKMDPLEVQRLREEVAYLRDKLNQQALAIDSIRSQSPISTGSTLANAAPGFISDAEILSQTQ